MARDEAPEGMVKVPAGEFMMGTEEQAIELFYKNFGWQKEWFERETPQRKIYIDEFHIDATPVTVKNYDRFLSETGRTASMRINIDQIYLEGNYPVVGVTWGDAASYAKWAGKRLPTEAEWEKAASWNQATWVKSMYPWGDKFVSANCAVSANELCAVDLFPKGKSANGCLNMCGLIWQWCDDRYEPKYYRIMPDRNPTGPGKSIYKSLRGGTWSSDVHQLRTTARSFNLPSFCDNTIGFRCVSNIS